MDNHSTAPKVNILDIILVFLRYWPIILISVIIFVGAGLFYYKNASKTYMVFARIAVNTERNNANRSSSNYVNVNDMMNQQKTFTNEISFIRSTPLIKQVIKDMNLFTSYYSKEDKIPKEFHFSLNNIYKNTPFFVIVDENSPQPLNTLFYLQIIDDDRFVINADESSAYIYNFADESVSRYPVHFAVAGTHKFGETIKNQYCSFKVLLNSNYVSDQYQGKDLFFKFNSPVEMAYKMQGSLTIKSAFFESSIADLTFQWENLELALDFLKQLVNKYIEQNLEKKNYNATNTIEYIDNQLANISGSLGKSEQQLQNFQASRDVINIDEKSSSLASQIQGLERDRDDIQMRYQYLSRLNDYLEANKDFSTFIAPSVSGISDATLSTLIQELTTLSSERQSLISTGQLRNARLKTLDANITNVKKVISDNIVFSMSSTQNELDEINSRITELNREFASLPQTKRQLVGLEREFNINDAVYSSLLDKRIQAQIIMASNQSDCEIIEPARYVEISAPSVMKIGFISIFLGMFFPSVYIILVNFLTQRIRSKEDLSRFCKLSSIGTIPHNDKGHPNVIAKFPQSPIAERFRAIRTNLVYFMHGEIHKTILITSTLPGEGKSFVSLNLAMSLAATQKKTLLIDFDLRKTSHTLDELKPADIQSGLSEYLTGLNKVSDLVIKTPTPFLDFINSGQVPPDPVGLLSSPYTGQLFAELKTKYDYIIIDTPPFGLVTDAFMLMQFADFNLYIARLGVITKKSIKATMEEIESKKIEKIYTVLNDTDVLDRAYTKNYAYEEPKKNKWSRMFSSKKKVTTA